MNDDPFSPEADPYRPIDDERVARRELLLGAAALVPLVAGCALTKQRLACAPAPAATGGCQHRFCRYHVSTR